MLLSVEGLDVGLLEKVTFPVFLVGAIVVLWRLVVYYGKKDQQAAESAMNLLHENFKVQNEKLNTELAEERKKRNESWELYQNRLVEITDGYKTSMREFNLSLMSVEKALTKQTEVISCLLTLPQEVDKLKEKVDQLKQ